MPIRSNIVHTNIFHYLKGKIAIYVKFYKIKRDENISGRHLCIYTLVTDGLQPIKLLLFKELLYKYIYIYTIFWNRQNKHLTFVNKLDILFK